MILIIIILFIIMISNNKYSVINYYYNYLLSWINCNKINTQKDNDTTYCDMV